MRDMTLTIKAFFGGTSTRRGARRDGVWHTIDSPSLPRLPGNFAHYTSRGS